MVTPEDFDPDTMTDDELVERLVAMPEYDEASARFAVDMIRGRVTSILAE